jgi:GAF domain-containing protein
MTQPDGPVVDRVDLVAAFTRLQSLTLSTARVSDFLSDLVTWAPHLAGAPLSASITVRGEHQPYTVTSSDQLADQADELQYQGGEGPCLTALNVGRTIYVEDMHDETRWDAYHPHAVAAGVGSSLSLPLQVDGTGIGALNLYSRRPQAFDERLRRNFTVFAAQAAAALAMVLRQARQDEISTQLEQALSSRTMIDQAMGILMAEQRCGAEEAFALLRAHSQNTNRRIRDLAADMIQSVTGATPSKGAPFNR